MQKARRPLSGTALLSPLVIYALFPFALAQTVGIESTQQLPEQTSSRVILIRLKTFDDRTIVASQYEGQMIRTGQEGGEMFGITPRILEDGSVALDFCRIRWSLKRSVI